MPPITWSMTEQPDTTEPHPAGRRLLVDFETGKIVGVAPDAAAPRPRHGTPVTGDDQQAAAA